MKPKAKAASADGPAVNCSFKRLANTGELKPNAGNPNCHGVEQLRLYVKILKHQGWRKPIVVSNQSGLIVTGHGAWLAAAHENWKRVPVDYQDFKTPADETAHMLADNRLPQLSELDEEQFAAILHSDLEGTLDLELAGVLEEDPAKTELKAVTIKPPPKMAWVLIGIPLIHFSKINADVERIAKLAETIVESTVNDDAAEQLET